MRALLVLLLLCLPLAASGCAEPGPSKAMTVQVVEARPVLAKGMAGLEGYIVDESFRPIGGARLLIKDLGRVLNVDQHGYYFSGAIMPGPYRLTALADRFSSHSQDARAVADEIGLYVFVLRPLPGQDEYQVVKVQRGFLACAVVVAPPGVGLSGSDNAGAAVEMECGVPRPGVGSDRTDGNRPVEPSDNSVRRWVLDEPLAVWHAGSLVTRWGAAQDLARVLLVDFGVEGCVDAARMFVPREGTSPVVQPVPEAEVRRVLEGAQGTTCTMPGERCDADSCVLSSRTRPAPRPVVLDQLRAGFAFQQAFDQELSATFRPAEALEGQTLK